MNVKYRLSLGGVNVIRATIHKRSTYGQCLKFERYCIINHRL